MSDREQVEAEAAEMYPVPPSHMGPRIHGYTGGARAAHVRAKTVTAEQVEAAAEAVHRELVDQSNRLQVDITVHSREIKLERALARAALTAAGLIVEEP